MKFNLPGEIVSKEDLKTVIEELKLYRAYLRRKQILAKVSKHKPAEEPSLTSPSIELINRVRENKPLGLIGLEQLISELEKTQTKLPQIRIVLAADPSTGLKRQLTSWIRDNINKDVLIDFRYNATILGGMVVINGSRISDWSIRNEIINNKDKLVQALTNV